VTESARRVVAALLTAGPIVYLAGEAISAAAWTDPAYSYAADWISDLGSTTGGVFQGRSIDSPLHDVMNAAFIVQGLLLAAAMVVLARALHGRLRRAVTAIGAAAGVGYLLLGVFHGSASAAADGTLALHFTGAALAILGGNVLALLLGIHWWRDPATRGLGHASAPLGALGLVATVVLLVTMGSGLPAGLIERIAVYPVVLWQLRVAVEHLRPVSPVTIENETGTN
jgi:hypothetical membrane protein